MIRVSDITTFNKCPRMCYFVNQGHDSVGEVSGTFIENLILKELALTYECAAGKDDKPSFLNNELERISKEIRVIYRSELDGIDEDVIEKSASNIQSLTEKISSNISMNVDFYSGEFIRDKQVLRSDKFGLSGSPDRLKRENPGVVPSIIKAGNIPENGVWNSDRLALTAYSILVEEEFNTIVEKGFVEYARWGIVRTMIIKRHERRKILQIRDKISRIKEGFMPERPKDAPCQYCNFAGICDVKSTLASRFF